MVQFIHPQLPLIQLIAACPGASLPPEAVRPMGSFPRNLAPYNGHGLVRHKKFINRTNAPGVKKLKTTLRLLPNMHNLL